MAIWQASLIGLFAYLGRNQVPWLFGTTGGWYGIGRPLVAGLICGIILGDVTAGVLSGVAVQAIFIGQITPGGAVPSDLNLAAYIGIPLAIVAGGDAATAVAFAVPLGALGVALHNFTMTVQSAFSHRADKYAEKANAKGVRLANVMGTSVSFIERFFIVSLTCYFGAPFAQNLLDALPDVVLNFLAVGGKLLPALGFAILLKQIIEEKWMIVLFIFGWVFASTFQITTTSLVFIATALALIYVMARYRNMEHTSDNQLSPIVNKSSTAYQDEEGNYEE
ncbi:PTS sugar transporter subunit IIC [Enterococcus saccharolyticus]|uniref:PTS mannose/fructose/sorbose/N-acetylgalactosamine transporter subunit IIC n=1 Tax=Enterococcus saccharolyticus TaxID=41997 RepID=UPI001E37EDBA|nr:PTS sugar transporter subunit IIC [Enterococcus saccharolyticus]MCD5002373.1 PTS sugar transporter subunit IIC [Enterococcus saccharolyticus]